MAGETVAAAPMAAGEALAHLEGLDERILAELRRRGRVGHGDPEPVVADEGEGVGTEGQLRIPRRSR